MKDRAPLTNLAGPAATVDLIAGALCLDFVNSVEPRAAGQYGGQPRDYLTQYADVVAWCLHAGSLTQQEAERLIERAARRPAAARATFAQALGLRETTYRVFYAIAARSEPTTADLDAISAGYAAAVDNMQLLAQDERFTVVWAGEPDDLTRPLWPIARSAFELLLAAEPARLKHCQTGGAGCGRLFYDTSKNNSRRWCSMRGCGGPEKERRRAERRRGND